MEKMKFYQKTWFTVLFLILFFPIGLFTMWKYKKFNKVARIIISVIFAILVIAAAFGNEDSGTSSDDTAETTTEATTETTTEATTETTTKATTEATTKATTETTTEKKLTKEDYNPEITYDDLARKPDEYKYKRITFQGTVVQVIEDNDNNQTQIRLATKNGYDDVIFIVVDRDLVKSRILEDDIIRFYGVSAGLITYESTIGGEITIPAASVEKVDFISQ